MTLWPSCLCCCACKNSCMKDRMFHVCPPHTVALTSQWCPSSWSLDLSWSTDVECRRCNWAPDQRCLCRSEDFEATVLDSALLVSELGKRPSKTRQCLCWEEEFIWPLAKEVLLLRKQQREVSPLYGQLPWGSRWGFQGTGMFPDATCALESKGQVLQGQEV